MCSPRSSRKLLRRRRLALHRASRSLDSYLNFLSFFDAFSSWSRARFARANVLMRLCCIQQGHGILVCSSRRSSASWSRVGPSLSSFPDTLLPRLSFPTSLSISTAERSGDFADTAPYIRFPIDPPLQLPQWGTPPDWCYPCNADSGTIIRVPTWSTRVR